MSVIQVQGCMPLKGEIEIQGSKNAVLPMMAAAILHKGTTVLTNVPRIQDVFCMMGILEYMGCVCGLDGNTMSIDASQISAVGIPEEHVRSMRSSVMILGPLLARLGEASIHYPGGCSIGSRPIDLHLYALQKLGTKIREEDGRVYARTTGLQGNEIRFPFPSVGATEHAILTAVLAQGNTRILGAAREPEIQELCRLLERMGARIRGAGTDCIDIKGVECLHDAIHRVSADRIVTGTYLSAVMAANGSARFTGADPAFLNQVIREFRKTGAVIETEPEAVRITMDKRPLPLQVATSPYPGFPTDLQSPFMAVLTMGTGTSTITENIFEGRYETARELRKLGADIIIEDRTARIIGCRKLRGGAVEATDLRGGAALVIAGLAAEGTTTVSRCGYILRGYEDICRDLGALGARIAYERQDSGHKSA
ncbi:MAG: UDP-N-acetylglucosamine 1-carboxyvinyltransferase [Lachnospiraceae bacterium]